MWNFGSALHNKNGLLCNKLCKLCDFFPSYFKHILQGFRGMKPLWGCSKDKLNIKGQTLNIYALIVIKKTQGAFPSWPSDSKDCQSQRCICSLSSMWKRYFLALSFTVKSGRKVWFSLFCPTNRGHFTTNLSFRHEFHQRNCILPLEWTSLGSLCCQYILTILISLSK